MKKTRALWHINSDESEVREKRLSDSGEGHVLVESVYSYISQGTEKLVASGQVPTDMYDRMQVPYMSGSFALPIQYGYSLVGKVKSNDENNDRWVHLMHPHQSHCLVKESDLYFLSDQLDPKRSLLLSNLETVINAVWDSRLTIGEKVLICGFGSIGSLLAMLISKMPGVDLYVFDKSEIKQKLITNLGFSLIKNLEGLKNAFDLAYNCSSDPVGLQMTLDSVGLEGRVVELSWFGTQEVKLKLGTDFHDFRKNIISSQVSRIPGRFQNRWDVKRRKELAQNLLEDPCFDVLLDREILLSEAPEYFKELRKGNSMESISTIIKY